MSFIKKAFGKFILKILGWTIIGENAKEDKYIAVIAPHTSIADMFMGKLYDWATGLGPSIMIKKGFFFFPLNIILKMWGGFPVDRKDAGGTVYQIVKRFEEKNKMILAITPEGTRAANPNWKTGFYRIAMAAKVPIYLLFVDFKEKKLGFRAKFEPTGNLKEDMKAIKRQYAGMTGYHPHKFSVGDIS